MMKVYVVMGNDYPDCVFAEEKQAANYVNMLNAQAKEDSKKHMQPRIHWRAYEFEVKQ